MKLCLATLLLALCHQASTLAVAHILSNYAKVAVNDGTQHERNASTTLPPTTTKVIIGNSTDSSEEEVPAYEDFDDSDAAGAAGAAGAVRGQQSSLDSQTMLKYFNGLVNLLALMYKFGGSPGSVRPQALHFSQARPQSPSSGRPQSQPYSDPSSGRPQSSSNSKSRPRSSGSDPLADSINQLAEDRFHPTTSIKKFKLQQSGGYSTTVDTFPPFNPVASANAETYSSNQGKTSYDSDASQYMIQNPEAPAMEKPNAKANKANDAMYSQKNPMNDYMTQNDPVEIQKSYSYEIPQSPVKTHQPWHPPQKVDPKPSPVYYPYKTMKQPPAMDHPWHSPPEEEEEDAPVYPWMKKTPKPKPEPPVDDEPSDEDESPPAWDMGPPRPKSKPTDDIHLYPWLSHSPPKKSKPAPPEEPEEDEASSWGMSPPAKAKPPIGPPPDDHPYPYFDHDHGAVYHPEEEEEEQEEDRESKRPYTYYHLGRKLWYVPLLFSLYFIVYIASLILKSIARHKVQFPEKLWELSEHNHHDEHSRRGRAIDDATTRLYTSLENTNNKFL